MGSQHRTRVQITLRIVRRRKMMRRRCMILLWLYMLLLKVKSDSVGDINMDASVLFNTKNLDAEEFNVGDLNVGDDLYDDLSEIVITVGELVKMYNNEENDTNKDNIKEVAAKKKFKKLEPSKT